MLAWGASAVVVVLIAVLVLVKAATGSSASEVRTPVSAAALTSLENIPITSLVAAAESASTGTVSLPTNLPTNVASVTSAGKPEILYIGAEYCPYCAAERWPLIMALSKFGTFSSLTGTRSSSTDANPDTPTFSFYGSTYSSPYLSFVAVEQQDRRGRPLQAPSAAETQLIDTYDTSPYTTGPTGAIPFIDLGGRYIVSGTEYDGSVLSGMSFESALAYMTTATTPTARAAQAVAAHLVGVMCTLTHNQPSAVCSAIPASLETGQAPSTNQGSTSGG
jgi:thiol-disulfide isomerase/thioredoxin